MQKQLAAIYQLMVLIGIIHLDHLVNLHLLQQVLLLLTFLLLPAVVAVVEAMTVPAAAAAQVDYFITHHNHLQQLITQLQLVVVVQAIIQLKEHQVLIHNLEH
jgi:hypothetical protein